MPTLRSSRFFRAPEKADAYFRGATHQRYDGAEPDKPLGPPPGRLLRGRNEDLTDQRNQHGDAPLKVPSARPKRPRMLLLPVVRFFRGARIPVISAKKSSKAIDRDQENSRHRLNFCAKGPPARLVPPPTADGRKSAIVARNNCPA